MRLKTLMAIVGLAGSLATAGPVIADRGVTSAATSAPGSGVARGSAFVVRGSGLGPESPQRGEVPFGLELGGVQVLLQSRANGDETLALLAEASTKRLLAIAPSGLAAGDYDLRVQFEGEQSKPYRIKIQDRNPGIVTTTYSNAGMGSAQLGDGESYAMRYIRPVVAGHLVKLDAAGFGPSEDDAGLPGEQQKLDGASVIVGEVEIPVDYAGRHPDRPGFDQLVFRLPAEAIQPSCVVPITLKVGDYRSEPAFLAIGAQENEPCEHPAGFDAQALRHLEEGGKLVVPGFMINDGTMEFVFEDIKFDMRSRSISGSFQEFDQEAMERSGLAYFSRYSKNGCHVVSYGGEVIGFEEPKALDAGEKVFISGSSGFSNGLDRNPANEYALDLPGGGIPSLPLAHAHLAKKRASTRTAAILDILPGEYNLMGYGGADIAEFLAQLKLSEPIAWSNKDAVSNIDRATDLEITWTPGPSVDTVMVVGVAGYAEQEEEGEEPKALGVMFTCEAPADRGALTVPVEILQRMPATAGLENAFSMLTVSHQNRAPNGDFSAKTVEGKSTEKGNFGFSYSWGKQVVFQ